jgi:hypothetical protein
LTGSAFNVRFIFLERQLMADRNVAEGSEAVVNTRVVEIGHVRTVEAAGRLTQTGHFLLR